MSYIENSYGFIDLISIENNKELLHKELDFINGSINGLAGLALTATVTILTNILIFKDELFKFIKFENIFMILVGVFATLIAIMFIYTTIYCFEMNYKNNYKKEIIEKINNLPKETKK